jgi:hypothetical protein
MRRLHGDGPRHRTCGDCHCFEEIDFLDDEVLDLLEDDNVGCVDNEGWCSSAGIPKARHYRRFVVEPAWDSCGLYKGHETSEKERLEAQGQLRIPFSALSAPPREI